MISIARTLSQIRRWKAFVGERVWRLFWLASLVGVFLFAIESSFIFVMQGFLKALGLVTDDKLLLPTWYPASLAGAMLALVCFGIFRGLALIAKAYLANLTYQSFMRLQRARILSYGMRHADEVSSHDVVALFTERVSQVGGALHGMSYLVLTLSSCVFFLLLGLRMAPLEMVTGLALLAIVMLPLKLMSVHIQRASFGLVSEWNGIMRALMQGLHHHLFLKIYGLIESEVAGTEEKLRSYERHFRRYSIVAAVKNAVPLIAGVFIISAITYLSVAYIHTPGIKLISFFYLFVRLAQGASEVNTGLADISLQKTGLEQLMEWFERGIKKAEAEKAQAAKPVPPETALAFTRSVQEKGVSLNAQGLSFSYGDSPLLENLNFQLGRGGILVVQGESGTGKSTLLTLLLGLNRPRSGKILVNGLPAEEVRGLLSEKVAYVGPEPYLIAGTVRENLLYGSPKTERFSDDLLWDCLRKAQLEKEIRALSRQLDEILHEITQLSTGQKQRLAIARALLRKPQLLILDEASANLDSATEGKFIQSLQPLLTDLTTVIISHKPSFNSIASSHLQLQS